MNYWRDSIFCTARERVVFAIEISSEGLLISECDEIRFTHTSNEVVQTLLLCISISKMFGSFVLTGFMLTIQQKR